MGVGGRAGDRAADHRTDHSRRAQLIVANEDINRELLNYSVRLWRREQRVLMLHTGCTINYARHVRRSTFLILANPALVRCAASKPQAARVELPLVRWLAWRARCSPITQPAALRCARRVSAKEREPASSLLLPWRALSARWPRHKGLPGNYFAFAHGSGDFFLEAAGTFSWKSHFSRQSGFLQMKTPSCC